MPLTRLTVALNTNRNTKTVLLLPSTSPADPTSGPTSIHAQVLKSAQTKLRLKVKKPNAPRFFVARTGAELLAPDDWARVFHDDAFLLISAGEDFVGKKEAPAADANPDATIAVLARAADVDTAALTQLRVTATSLPGIVQAAGQPDLHPGNKFPIGAVFVSKGWIHPPLIGGDIGCGMAWYKTTLSRSQVDGEKGKKVAEQLRGLEGPWREQAEREYWMGEGNSAGEEWDRSLGTIGAGNHFAEIQVVEKADEELELKEGEVLLLVHSGSRGYGGDILKRYAADGHNSLKEGEEVTNAYLEEHDRACRWAKANRDLIALRFFDVLEPGGAWSVGSDVQQSVVEGIRKHVQTRKVVDIWHNNVQRMQWPPKTPNDAPSLSGTTTAASSLSLSSSPESQQYAYIHRKGAAPTLDPDTFNPLAILPLPGSRATPTVILAPTFSPSNAHGATNALSLAHGAGRAMSRAKALQSLCNKYKGDTEGLLKPGKVAASAAAAAGTEGDQGVGKDAEKGAGTWVVCEEKQLVWEEAPEAYKDVWAVAGDLIGAGAAEIRGWCAPRISYKVRNT